MKKKALLIAVSDANGSAPHLEAAVPEMNRWQELLAMQYRFSTTPLPEDRATPRAVLDALGELLHGAQPDDQLIFVAVCHGTLVRAQDGRLEHALLVFPPDGVVEHAAVGFSEFSEVFRTERPPRGTDITFILESCFSGAYGNDPPNATPLYVRPNLANLPRGGALISFLNSKRTRRSLRIFGDPMTESPSPGFEDDRGLLSDMEHSTHGHGRIHGRSTKLRTAGDVEEALIVAASGPLEAAFQIPDHGVPRMLFSMRAIERLWQPGDLTFRELIQEITPLRPDFPDFPQVPELRGNQLRRDELFPGKADHGETPIESPASRPTRVRLGPGSGISTESLGVGGSMDSLNVRIAGICCFLNPGSNKRVVLPIDTLGHGHIPFLEIAEEDEDIAKRLGKPPAESGYVHLEHPMQTGTVTYRRWHLTNHRVVIDNINTQALVVTAAYSKYVPQMQKILPELNAYPDTACFKLSPQQKVAGYCDIAYGELGAGMLGEIPLYFDPHHDWPAPDQLRGRAPRWVYWKVPLLSNAAKLTIYKFKPGEEDSPGTKDTEITLNPGTAWVTIGNQLKIDIEGRGAPDPHPEHFRLYYTLAESDPSEHPVPIEGGVPLNTCSPTDWP